MISKEEAINKVRNTLCEHEDVILDATIEKEYGWVIFSQTKKYIETGDEGCMSIGSGGTLVEKKTGNIYEFGSSYSLDKNLRIYELGYLQYDNWDIVIHKIRNISNTVDHLLKLNICYVTPEEEGGIIWKIPREYTAKQLKDQLKYLPARFRLGGVYYFWEALESFKEQSDFEYQLSENKGHENSI